ncbi:MAG: uracil-DNA glycosylase [Candidatus Aenigmarchaeota archaeon]|nr:uracil-DNA glycosylase [Candidatus Aenigmarchaeota archaeon]
MKKDRIEQLNRKITKIFHKKYGKIVFGHGKINAQIMLIAEAPGRQEEIHGRPFVGRAGKVLDQALAKANIARNDVYISNTVKFRPPNNRKPKRTEIEDFLPTLHEEIGIIKPNIICLLGLTAIEALLGKGYTIRDHSGKIIEKNGMRYLISYHPAAILRNATLKPAFELSISKLEAFK